MLKKLLEDKKKRWIVIIIASIYVLSPIDFLPEIFIPGVGLIDDGVVLAIIVGELVKIRKKEKQKKN